MRRRSTFAAVFDEYGPATAMRFEEVDRPQPGPGEVLVQVLAAGVSHMDAYVRDGRFRDELPLELPARTGLSFSGIVRAVGPDVRGVRVGDEVLGHDPQHGAHATHVVVEAAAVVRKPDRVTWEVAGSLYLVGLAAFTLTQELRLGADDTVLVTAAAGGVGHIECQLARLAGARVIGIAGAENHDYLRSIGARPVTYGDAMRAGIDEAAAGRPISAVFDNFGGYEQIAGELDVPADRVRTSAHRRDVEVRLWSSGADRATATRLSDVAELVAEWNLRVLVSGYYPLQNLVDAFEELDARHNRGVVVVGMNPTAPAQEYLRPRLRARVERLGSAKA